MGQIAHVMDAGIAGVELGSQFSERWNTKTGSQRGVLPVVTVLESLLPGAALERGHCYALSGDAPLSLLFALVARATQEGAWFAMVDMPHAGLMSAHEHGVALQRVLCVSTGRTSRTWPTVVGALVAGIDIIAVSAPHCSPADARRMTAHVKAHGAVVLVVGDPGPFSVDATFSTRTLDWSFDTHAQARNVMVQACGRRVHVSRSCVVQLPAASGSVEAHRQ